MGQQEPEVEVDAVAVAQKVSAPPGSAAVTYGGDIPTGNAASSVPMWQQEKVGAKCCGCCCDYRRAVIVVEIISIVVYVINMISVVTMSALGASGAIEDDKVEDVVQDSVPILAAIYGISLLASICGLVGALKFNVCLVAVDLVWMAGTYSHWTYSGSKQVSCVSMMLTLCGCCSGFHRRCCDFGEHRE